MLLELVVYLVVVATWGVVLCTRFMEPSLLSRVTLEDGPVEWATVASLLTLMGLLLWRLPSCRMPGWLRACGYLLAILCLLAAGEEISWGQRLLGLETPETLKSLNYQQELNVHNLIKAELFNGFVVFSCFLGFILFPMAWRKTTHNPPGWLPSRPRSLMMMLPILVNHYRFASLPEQIGMLVLLLLLAYETWRSLGNQDLSCLLPCLLSWGTIAILFPSRQVLRLTNHQYEIRELLIVLVVLAWSLDILKTYSKSTPQA